MRGPMTQDAAKTDTRTGLLLAAERLFALQGVAATTIRQINAAAGQRNQSAIHYHFGSRDGILDAIMDLRVPPMNQARAALLERMRDEAGARPLTSREIVTALIQPNLDRLLATPGPHFTARLLLQMRVDHDIWRRYARAHRAWTLDDIRAEIARANPFAPPEALASRFRQVVSLSMFQVAEIERAQDQLGPGFSPEEARFRIEETTTAMGAILDAPVSPGALAWLRRAPTAEAPRAAAPADGTPEPPAPDAASK